MVLKGHVCCEEISGLWHCMRLLDMRAHKISLNSTIVGVFFGEDESEQTQKTMSNCRLYVYNLHHPKSHFNHPLKDANPVHTHTNTSVSVRGSAGPPRAFQGSL